MTQTLDTVSQLRPLFGDLVRNTWLYDPAGAGKLKAVYPSYDPTDPVPGSASPVPFLTYEWGARVGERQVIRVVVYDDPRYDFTRIEPIVRGLREALYCARAVGESGGMLWLKEYPEEADDFQHVDWGFSGRSLIYSALTGYR